MKKILFCWIVCIFFNCFMVAVFAADANYDRLIDREKFRRLDRSTAAEMQRNLAQIYQGDLEWDQDFALSWHPLTDGVLGTITLYWLHRFARDFKIEPAGQYVHEIRKRLERIALFSEMFPEETNVLTSADFANWNDGEAEEEKNAHYKVRRKGTNQELLDLVHRYLRGAHMPPGSLPSKAQPVIYYYGLTADDFEKLQGKSQLFKQLSTLVNKKFDNAAALKEGLAGALKDNPELIDKLAQVFDKYYRYADPVISQSFLETLAGDSFFSSLNSVLVTLLEKSMKDAAYPDKNLFDKAAISKIYAGIGACQDGDRQNAYSTGLKISDDDFKKMSDDLLTGPYGGMRDFSWQLGEIGTLRQQPREICKAQDLAMIDEFVTGLYEQVVQPAIALHYKKNPLYRAKLPVQWESRGCGCVIDDLAGVVYGFYPFWLAGEMQSVNFSVLSRVAYYGLSFDDDGVIKQANSVVPPPYQSALLSPVDVSRNAQAAFVQVARRHNSKVDWVIQNDRAYWERWHKLPYPSREIVLRTLTENIVNFLTSRITDPFANIKHDLTLGIVTPPTMGDGVTLYFDGFPDDRKSVELFNQFFTGLQKRLSDEQHDYYINVMMPQSALGTGIYRHPNLIGWIDNRKSFNSANVADKKTNILVLIDEPTTDSKKILRSNIESGELHGIERSMLMWHIIPVIESSGRDWQQLEDDIIYFKDNFGGVGFWPMPVNEPEMTGEMPLSCAAIQSVSGCLVRFFQSTNWYGYGEPDSWLEKFVCENRAYFRIAMGLLVALCLIYIGLYFYSCYIRRKMIRKNYVTYLLLIVVPALIIALLLLSYDPQLEELSKGNLPLITVVFGGIILGIVIYQRKKKQMRKPSRPRARHTASRA